MELPEGYVDALTDELSGYGFEFAAVTSTADGTIIDFTADPDSFVRAHPELGIEESHGSDWPPAALHLLLGFDRRQNPVQFEFETVDLLLQTASADPELHDRLNTLSDPDDHAVAVGQAVGEALSDGGSASAYLE